MFLGVDGGGTKTEFLLLDASGHVLARHQEAGSYYIQAGMQEVRRVLIDGTRAVLNSAGASSDAVTFAFFGLPAHGEDSANTALLDALPQAVLPADRYRCGNDMVCGWAGSLACRDGINVVAGTGSICYGEYRGRSARCGGWGELFSDEGSAYWIAREGLALFSKMSDGRLPKGPLHSLLVERLQLRVDLDLSDLIFNHWHQERSRIAALSQWVKDAADAGDAAAQDVFKRAGSELAQMIDATRRTLGFDGREPIEVSYSGGAFNAGAWLLNPLTAALRAASSRYRVIEPMFAPAIGAALYAARCAGSTLTEESLQRLTREAPAADAAAP